MDMDQWVEPAAVIEEMIDCYLPLCVGRCQMRPDCAALVHKQYSTMSAGDSVCQLLGTNRFTPHSGQPYFVFPNATYQSSNPVLRVFEYYTTGAF